MAHWPVHHWPACGNTPAPTDGLLVIAVHTPRTAIRDTARQSLRAAVADVLAGHGIAAQLMATPGKAPHLAGYPHIGLSLTHEPGLSLAAIHFAGPVGIDLFSLASNALPAAEIRQLARDYLDPTTSRLIGDDPETFAEAWTQHEARLKCLGLALTEWMPAQQERLATCRCIRLALPDEWIGTLAVPA